MRVIGDGKRQLKRCLEMQKGFVLMRAGRLGPSQKIALGCHLNETSAIPRSKIARESRQGERLRK
jgi:hypothetical protein